MVINKKTRYLKFTAALILVLAAQLSSCNSDTNNPMTTTTTITTTSATTSSTTSANAASIYSSVCGKCHGFNREGGIGSPLTMNDLTGRTIAELSTILANHPADGNLTPAQREELATWLKSTP